MKKQEQKITKLQRSQSRSKLNKTPQKISLTDPLDILKFYQTRNTPNPSSKRTKYKVDLVRKLVATLNKIAIHRKQAVLQKMEQIINEIKWEKKFLGFSRLSQKIFDIQTERLRYSIQKLRKNVIRKKKSQKFAKSFLKFGKRKILKNYMLSLKCIIYYCLSSNNKILNKIRPINLNIIYKMINRLYFNKKKLAFNKILTKSSIFIFKKSQRGKIFRVLKHIYNKKISLWFNGIRFFGINKNTNQVNKTPRAEDRFRRSYGRIGSNFEELKIDVDRKNEQIIKKNEQIIRLQNELNSIRNDLGKKNISIKQYEKRLILKQQQFNILNKKLEQQNEILRNKITDIQTKYKQLQAELQEQRNQLNMNILQSDSNQSIISGDSKFQFDNNSIQNRSKKSKSKNLDQSYQSSESKYSNFSLNTVNFLKNLQEKGHKNCKYKSKYIQQLKVEKQLKQKLQLMQAEYQLMAQINKHFEKSIYEHVNKPVKVDQSLFEQLKKQYQQIKQQNQDLKLKINSYKAKITKLQQEKQKSKKDFKKKLQQIYIQLKKKTQTQMVVSS